MNGKIRKNQIFQIISRIIFNISTMPSLKRIFKFHYNRKSRHILNLIANETKNKVM